MTLEARVDRLENALIRLAEAQERTVERLGELEARLLEFQLRTEEQFARVEAQIATLTERMERVEAQIEALTREVIRLTGEVGRLADWQRGEAGRREGERYERQVSLRARRLLGTGWGGTPADEPELRKWLEDQLETAGLEPEEEADPVLADLIWRKDAVIIVAEVSIAVEGDDVRRARRRADTVAAALGSSYKVIPAVIGRHWASARARELARELKVEWYIEGSGPSPDLLELRRRF